MLFIDEHGVSQRAELLCGLNRLRRQIRLGVDVMQWVNPRPGIFGAAGILSHGDDFKILVFQLLVDCLPAWQVKAASSPRSPCHQQDFLAVEVRKAMRLALKIRQREVWRLQ